MASLTPTVGGIPQSLKWEIKDYAFDPYELTAEKLASSADEGLTKPPLGKAGAAAADAPVKRRPGRQKRTSVLCQVDGCGEELVDAKTYYRRYRICQLHCNMPSMTIDGRRQRFCQQCGRFHDIGEFESAKRSCKRKLKRHNERRRTSIMSTSKKAATWQSDSEADAEDAYNKCIEMDVKVEGTTKRRSRRSMPTTLAPEPSPPPSVSEPALKSLPSGDSAASQNTATASRADGGYMGGDSPSICGGGALSAGHRASVASPSSPAPMQPMHSANLDSSPMQCSDDPDQQAPAKLAHVATLAEAPPPAPSSFSPHILNPWRQASQQEASPTVTTAPGSPLPATALACAPTSTLTDGDLDSVLQQLLQDEELQGLQLDPLEMFMPQEHADMAIKTEPHCISMERAASHAPTSAGGNTWATQQFVHADPQSGVPALADLPLKLLDNIPLIPLPEEMAPSSGSAGAASTAGSGRSGATTVPTTVPASRIAQAPMLVPQHALPSRSVADMQGHPMPSGVLPSVMASAHSMLSLPGFNGAPLVAYSMHHSTETITCVSLKVFNCTPDQLLPSVRQELESLLSVGQTLLEGCVRPGCTQLTLNALMTKQRIDELKAGGFVGMVSQLLANTGNNDAMQQDMLVQFEGELAVVKRRKVVALITLKSSPAVVPALAPLLPLAVHATAAAPASTLLLLRGRHMCADEDLILARQQGRNLTVEMHVCGAVQSGEYAKVRVLGLLPGCADVEVQHGTILSQPRALLALPSLAAVAEVRQLERCVTGTENLDGMLRDIGLVVQYLQRDALQAEGYACPHYTPALLASIANKARRLVAAAAARGWAATTQMLLPAVTADGLSGDEAVAGLNACCPSSMTLLHVAVGTGSIPLVHHLASWANSTGCRWEVDARGGTSGVTPLHVAALLPNADNMRAVLTAMTPATTKLWGLVQADDGTTPEGLAEAVAAAATAATAATTAAEIAPAQPAVSSSPGCSSSIAELAGAEAGACKDPSSSKAEALTDDELSAISSSSQAPQLHEAGTKSKGGAEDSSSLTIQRRRGRQAIKQHLGDMYMSTILSEVESGANSAARDPRPLADVLSAASAAGAALLRALRT